MDWDNFDEQLGGLLNQAQEAMDTFVKRCNELDQLVQPQIIEHRPMMLVSGPRLTDEQVNELLEMVPRKLIKIQFTESVRRSTLEGISDKLKQASPYLITQIGLIMKEEADGAELKIHCVGTPPEGESVWRDIGELLKNDSFIDSWSCQVNEKVLWEDAPVEDVTPATSSRPQTDRPAINDDDVIDLKAALGKSQTVEEFMDQMFGEKDD